MAKPYFTKSNPKQRNGSEKPDPQLLNELESFNGTLRGSPTSNSIERDDIPTLNDIAVPSVNEEPHSSDDQISKKSQATKSSQENKAASDIPTLTAPTNKSAAASHNKPALTPPPYHSKKQTTPSTQHKVNINNPFIPESVKAAQVEYKQRDSQQQTTLNQDKQLASQKHPEPSVNKNTSQHDQSLDNLRKAKCLDEGVRNKLRRELEMQSEIVLQEVIDEFIPQIEAEFHKRIRSEINDIIDQIVNH